MIDRFRANRVNPEPTRYDVDKPVNFTQFISRRVRFGFKPIRAYDRLVSLWGYLKVCL